MKKVCFLDFDDSFTYNIIQELTDLKLKVEVVHWQDFEQLPQSDLLVLGPGPGHPDDYQRIFPLVQQWLDRKLPLFAICLGHQIFWRLQGEDIVQSKEPLHGQKIKLKLTPDWQQWLNLPSEVWVQRYNSLAVMGQSGLRNPYLKNLLADDEIVMTRGENILTYQFHPESMGTSFRRSFFLPLTRELV